MKALDSEVLKLVTDYKMDKIQAVFYEFKELRVREFEWQWKRSASVYVYVHILKKKNRLSVVYMYPVEGEAQLG